MPSSASEASSIIESTRSIAYPTASKIGYVPELDGLRAVAISLVLLGHFAGPVVRFLYLPSPGVGVRLFFVISGFLITGILLQQRDRAAMTGQTLFISLRQFYARRTLRIFPIYFFAVAYCLVVGFPGVRSLWLMLVTYTSNWYTTVTGQWPDASVAHFWSLAVEEQFYLLWPFLILVIPSPKLRTAIIAVIFSSWLGRAFMAYSGANFEQVCSSSLGSADALAAGGLLACYSKDQIALKRHSMINVILALAIMAVAFLHIDDVFHRRETHTALYTLLHDPLVTLLATWIVAVCIHSSSWAALSPLRFTPVTYIGRISYGLYVYHMIVRETLLLLYKQCGWSWDQNEIPRVIIQLTMTFVVAAISWHFFESPINDKKKYFPYVLNDRSTQ